MINLRKKCLWSKLNQDETTIRKNVNSQGDMEPIGNQFYAYGMHITFVRFTLLHYHSCI